LGLGQQIEKEDGDYENQKSAPHAFDFFGNSTLDFKILDKRPKTPSI